MIDSEKFYRDNYFLAEEVSKKDCRFVGHNCGVCMHYANHDVGWRFFESGYCTTAKKPRGTVGTCKQNNKER